MQIEVEGWKNNSWTRGVLMLLYLTGCLGMGEGMLVIRKIASQLRNL